MIMRIASISIVFFLFFLFSFFSCRSCRETMGGLEDVSVSVDSLTAFRGRSDSVVSVMWRVDSVIVKDSVEVIVRGDSVLRSEWHWRERVRLAGDSVRMSERDTLWRDRVRNVYRTKRVTLVRYKDKIRSIGWLERILWIIGVCLSVSVSVRLTRNGLIRRD